MCEVSDEYLQSFLVRFNVDGSEISNKRLDDMLQHVVSQEVCTHRRTLMAQA